MNGERLARGLGWFSIGIGIAEIAAPKTLARTLGLRDTRMLRLCGMREIVSGAGILSRRSGTRPWIWLRAAGDVLDLALLAGASASGRKKGRFAAAAATVAGVTALDLLCARRISEAGVAAGFPRPVGSAQSRIQADVSPGSPPLLRYGPDNRLDINGATREDLLSIDGISPRAAEAILKYRDRHGHISRMYDLERLPRLSADEFMTLRDTVQIVAETEEEEAHRLEKPDMATEVGGRGM